MSKTVWKPGTMLMPVPAVMLSCQGEPGGRPNLITVAWAGTVCSTPPMLSVAIMPARFSHGLIRRNREFVVNIPSQAQLRAVDQCGVWSGRDTDKFARTGLTPVPAQRVGAPLVAECPINIECRVRDVRTLGSHDLFLAEIMAVHVAKDLVGEGGRLAVEKARLIAFAHGHYYLLGKRLGRFGFAVRKR
ncbi:MAG: flavin reductase [Lentisphaerae bacterium RIFOXYB12_FULL_65_16]|nr:MAG: flavin reductase [Lentisphaerae bacterium RIFOXYA12_64_32]OGV88423.1 MAG: flavin reductase [Lentisphaerae bacterium RIFOXYB12_FULL_65_16]